MNTVTACPICEQLIDIPHAYCGQELECPECHEVFRLVSLSPIVLAYAYDTDEAAEYSAEDYPRAQ